MTLEKRIQSVKAKIEATEQELRVCNYRQIRSPEVERRERELEERIDALEEQLQPLKWLNAQMNGEIEEFA